MGRLEEPGEWDLHPSPASSPALWKEVKPPAGGAHGHHLSHKAPCGLFLFQWFSTTNTMASGVAHSPLSPWRLMEDPVAL